MTIVGFDFGTTNSLISLIKGDRAINFLDEQERPIPSVVCYEGAQKFLGREAKERLAHAGLGVQGNIVRSPKMYLGRDSVYVEGVERSPVDIVADVVEYVLQRARGGDRELESVSGAVVTIPVDMDGRRRRALRNAFLKAGLRIVQFVHEPLAALYGYFRSQDLQAMLRQYDKKLVLVFDWGGGTLDLTLCRPLENMVIQLKNDGTDEVGGDVFDEAIMNQLIQSAASKRAIDVDVETQPGARARLMDHCERAKIDLSSRSTVQIFVRSFFRGIADEDFDYILTDQELESIVEPLLDKGFRRISRMLEDAGYVPGQVALCLATGGMSNMPAVKRRLHEWFGPERVRIPDGTATLIAEGAAWIASDAVGLQLAKNVELSLARNSYFPLVKAGTAMPREGDVQQEGFSLYCTDPRDGVAKFEICTPRRAGASVLPSEPRVHLENVTVKVDSKAQAFHERLELTIRINDDLILEATAQSLNLKDRDSREIHNLEFGLQFPKIEGGGGSGEGDDFDQHNPSESSKRGALTLRSNISVRKDLSLVPGEFLHQYHASYFDPANNPPRYQDLEKLYYQPCSVCGRASNDPGCRCLSLMNSGKAGAHSRDVQP